MEDSIVYDRIPKCYKRAILEEKDGYTDYLTGSKECYREYTNGGVYDEDAQLLVGLDYEGFALPKKHIFLGDYSPEKYKGLIKN